MSHYRRRAACARLRLFAVAVAAWLVTAPALAQGGTGARPQEREVVLSELLTYATRHAPRARIALREKGYAEAERAGAAPLLHDNPTLELGVGPRFSGTRERDFDFIASLTQPIEIAGERGLRMDAAARLGERLEADALALGWEVRRDVTLAFWSAVVARARVAVSEKFVVFAEEMSRIAQRRLSAGDATIIDVRLAETELAQARYTLLLAEQELASERLRLAEVTGWSIEAPPNVPGVLVPAAPVPELRTLIAAVREQHPELRARKAAVAEAVARVSLASREAWPTPNVGVQVAREGSAGSPANYIVLGTLGLSLPVWQSNQGQRARSRVDEDVARVQESVAERTVQARIARAHAELAGAAERLALFTTSVTPQLEDSLGLLRRGFDAGELGLSTIAVARERFLSAERDALAAYADYYRARAELEFALGDALPVPSAERGAR